MKVCSVIAEFDPFHNGHDYLLKQARKLTNADVLIVLMSGNFLQRGEPAIIDKWKRTREALTSQADLVIELPISVSMQAAHLFAQGAVSMAAQLKSDYLVFGSEHPKLNYNFLVDQFKDLKFDKSEYAQSFAAQLFETLAQKTGIELKTANDILAFNYFLANKNNMTLIPVPRMEAEHSDHSLHFEHFASASAIRQARFENQDNFMDFIPEQTKIDLEGSVVNWDNLWPYLSYRLLSISEDELRQIYGISEGIENRIKAISPQKRDFATFLKALKTKRFTYTHLQRLCLAIVLNLKKEQMLEQKSVFRILGFNKVGQQYLHYMQELNLPMISKIGKKEATGVYRTTYQVDQIYSLLTGEEQNIGRKPIILP
ncbi:nucleotidyltransferase [Pediococcus ethanolidurans]|uniref:tRNA(Met) cytidine acetate ligase n=1 Tax=Pediococcus ethanolidurans TaxID=319653 RepID=A0A0R2K4Z5_9LACO|nr:nucleotidyltransferase [Pediococcus ethanolidurans]KRN82389.1 nucleotidyltransferase [Pediococcus ethanolidurans]GEN94322.1 UPF0348 protein [Pediococcus ethanolidurans]SER57755.1 cytidyltransferase-like domain-containing protein [Pediococcus ethanolidurans]